MIRKLTAEDDAACQALIHQKPAENLFIIGDIEAFGYEESFQTLYGDFSDDGRLKAVLLKYYGNYIAYADQPFDAEGFADIINHDSEFRMLSGIREIAESILPYISKQADENRELYYAKCDSSEQLKKLDQNSDVQKATLADVPQLAAMQRQIPEFSPEAGQEESMRNGMERGVARTYYIKQDDAIVSSASTTAENTKSAMVVGVCTLNAYKHRGLASQCMVHLCRDVLAEGKMLCLFYDNPEAGKIYKRLGFRDIGMWMMHSFKKSNEPTHA
ncbi:GNAT family N-acetyltransferase [Thalassobacillus sp. CUG 92003]|uniref:GNAT family N-acetyltransferase n=1 Tax=Thalassobacillus sp. CUG 92003 TaxID=2736641 RepID=UPI0015E6CE5A|nr:GNAT family N-acetyltransferase [Thalassobacillus sp. CUG 92003]